MRTLRTIATTIALSVMAHATAASASPQWECPAGPGSQIVAGSGGPWAKVSASPPPTFGSTACPSFKLYAPGLTLGNNPLTGVRHDGQIITEANCDDPYFGYVWVYDVGGAWMIDHASEAITM
jgi:hypothetical protein